MSKVQMVGTQVAVLPDTLGQTDRPQTMDQLAEAISTLPGNLTDVERRELVRASIDIMRATTDRVFPPSRVQSILYRYVEDYEAWATKELG